MYDVCVIGHVSRDIISLDGRPRKERPGGVIYYAGIAFRSLGLDTVVVTKADKEHSDEILRDIKKAGTRIHCTESGATTVFENIYSGDGFDSRHQKVPSIGASFAVGDLGQVRARTFYLGPLTSGEMSIEFLKAVSKRVLQGGRVFLDVQGFLRMVEQGEVRLVDWRDKGEGLALVDVLKANLVEAQILSKEEDPERAARTLAELGPREVIVTLGSQGSLIVTQGRMIRIPAIRPRTVVDPTGCGDTYGAGYVFHRFHQPKSDHRRNGCIEAAGRFAAALATLKLECDGPYMGGVHLNGN